MPEAVIVSTARSPIGRAHKGSLTSIRPDDLAVQMIKAAVGKVGLTGDQIEDLAVGCAEPHDEHGGNMARRIAVQLGWDNTPATTVNRFCASSTQTARMAFHAIKSGEGDVFVSAGVECVSRYKNFGSAGVGDPSSFNQVFADAVQRTEKYAETNDTWHDPREDGLIPDIYISMGQTAENVATLKGISRADQDVFGVRSQNLAEKAIGNGFFEREIVPVTLPDGTVVSKDDGPRPGTTLEKLSELKPVFRPDGEITAGNACPLNDGAAAVVVMSDTRARELGITPIARIVASGVTGLNPEIMGLGPIEACRQALKRAGMTIDDVDLVEINEAFAAQVIPSARHLGIDWDKLNVNGGAIALGHPFGMTGARIMTTLINGLQNTDSTVGLESMCVGGGQGMAMLIERLR